MTNQKTSKSSRFVQFLKQFFLSAFLVLTFVAYVIHEKFGGKAAAASSVPPSNPPVAASGSGENVIGSPNSTSTAPASPLVGQYKNGTFTGPEVDAFFGLVKVSVVIQNGKLTDVKFLEYPNDRRTSREINAQAMPWLTQEAIQAQSANVDIISGATLTSEAFATSLQAALDSAKN